MAGKLSARGAVALFALCLPAAFAQTATDEKPAPGTSAKRPGWFDRKRGADMSSPEFENARKAIEALTPEQRKRFQENLWRWTNLTPEEKKSLADLQTLRRKKMAEEIDAAVKETGLELDPPRRELFAKRYGEERRKIEEQLRKESEAKRKPMIKEVIGRLKSEFSAAAAAPTVAPSAAQ